MPQSLNVLTQGKKRLEWRFLLLQDRLKIIQQFLEPSARDRFNENFRAEQAQLEALEAYFENSHPDLPRLYDSLIAVEQQLNALGQQIDFAVSSLPPEKQDGLRVHLHKLWLEQEEQHRHRQQEAHNRARCSKWILSISLLTIFLLLYYHAFRNASLVSNVPTTPSLRI